MRQQEPRSHSDPEGAARCSQRSSCGEPAVDKRFNGNVDAAFGKSIV